MKQDPTLPERNFDLGTWLGRRQAFSLMAGKASAADVECLRTIRDRKLYKAKTERWSEFCSQFIGSSKTQVDRLIRHLEEFGPHFFELTNVARITAETYRLIAGSISDQGIQLDGQHIELTQENSSQVSSAVAELRRRAEPPKKAPLPRMHGQVKHDFQYAMLAVNFEQLIELIEPVKSLAPIEKREIEDLQLALDEHIFRLCRGDREAA